MFRKVIFWAHLITGVTVGIVILIMAVTGSIMAFEPQIVDFAERGIRRIELPAPGTARLTLEQIAAKAKEVFPGKQPAGAALNSAPESSVVIMFGKDGSAYVNPYTGEILGKGSKTHEFMHWIEDIHRKLANGDNGKAVTGFCNAAFFFLVTGGLYLWLPRSWNRQSVKAITVFNSELKGKPRDWNWHNVIGFWCLPLLLVTTLTGMIMSYTWASNLLYKMTGNEPPAQQQMKKQDGPKDKSSFNFDILLAGIERQVPEWRMATIRLKQPGEPVSVFLLEKDAKREFMKSQLVLDPKTGATVKWEPFAAHNAGRKARVWARYLHTGEAFGWVNQTLMFIAALGAVLLVWTGFSMSWYRFTNWLRRRRNNGKNTKEEVLSMKTFFNPVILLCFSLFAPSAHAHSLWMEKDSSGTVGVCFGEYGEGLREKTGGKLDNINVEAWTIGADGKKIPATVKRAEDRIVIENAQGNAIAQDVNRPIRVRKPEEMKNGGEYSGGTNRSFLYTRFAENTSAAQKPEMKLDVVPAAQDSIQVYFDGKPLGEAKVSVIAPNGWIKEFKADSQGVVKLEMPWRGLYVIDVTQMVDKPGEFQGQAYEAERHHAAFSTQKA